MENIFQQERKSGKYFPLIAFIHYRQKLRLDISGTIR